jgi:PleD family two-component response regulator
MLFAGEDGVKKVKVLSGGEKVRCLLSKLMISILIVEDDNDINNLICNTLKAEGYQCERAFDGKEGALHIKLFMSLSSSNMRILVISCSSSMIMIELL